MFFFLMIRRPPRSPPFPYATLFRSHDPSRQGNELAEGQKSTDVMHLCIKPPPLRQPSRLAEGGGLDAKMHDIRRSEEHTSELQSHLNLVFPLLLETKNFPSLTPLPS